MRKKNKRKLTKKKANEHEREVERERESEKKDWRNSCKSFYARILAVSVGDAVMIKFNLTFIAIFFGVHSSWKKESTVYCVFISLF